jgi:6-phosphogluconolactonase/glucosamine-6-phosphate isomerase/deaminase
LITYLEKLESLGGIDIFFVGLGPEAEAASHVCYIKPNSGATYADIAGIIPISSSILEHHIGKFKVGGSEISPEDEAECRKATHILTLGPAAILGARRIVQSIVDASTAPGKVASFKRMIESEISSDPVVRSEAMRREPWAVGAIARQCSLAHFARCVDREQLTLCRMIRPHNLQFRSAITR